MESIEKIRKEFRNYLKEQAKLKGLSKKDVDTQYSDADYPRKHAKELGIDYWESFKNNENFEYMISVLNNNFKQEGKSPSTIAPYKRALNNFRSFIDKHYSGVENLIKNFSSLSVNSYEQLIISYLENHGKTTIDKLYEYISSIKSTGKTGKRYLREVVTSRYQGSDIFEYDNPYVWLKDSNNEDSTLYDKSNGTTEYKENQIDEENYQITIEKTIKDIGITYKKKNVTAKKQQRTANNYIRDPQAAAYVKQQAGYKCEFNKEHKTFISDISGKQYVEAHHLIPMKYQDQFEYSLDIPENIVALCPNCHRAIHHGTKDCKKKIISALFNKRKKILKDNSINIDIETLNEMYK